jgi:ADP-ribose diphosphatase
MRVARRSRGPSPRAHPVAPGGSRYNRHMRKPPLIHDTRVADHSQFMRVEHVDLEFSNGERRTYERIPSSGLGAVIIVPMLDDDTVLLVREYGVGVGRFELGLPKGRLDRDETAEQGANRELKEEVGYGARDLRILASLSLSPSYMTAMSHVVLARDLYPERLPGDEPEELEVIPWKMSGLHTLLAEPEVSEGRSIAALFIAREYLAGRYRPRA